MRNHLLFLLLFSQTLSACPAGMMNGTDRFGNTVCLDGGRVRLIAGSLRRCPVGFFKARDDFDNAVCTDGRVFAYPASTRCPAGLMPHWDDAGRETCEAGGRPVMRLWPGLSP